MPVGANDAILAQLMTMGYRTTLGSGSYLPIGMLVSVDGPGTTVDEVETPLLSSTTKLYAAGLPESELTFNIRFNNTNPACTALRGAIKNYPVPVYDWEIVYPDGTTDTFQGFPKGFTVSGGEGAVPLMAAIPVRITTTISNAATASS